MFGWVTTLGGTATTINYPYSVTHRNVGAEMVLDIHPGLLRVSVGLEAFDDLQAELLRGLAAIDAE